ncbi:MAG TPA: NAD-dependent succinate-semialdehyde dehydrogenase [Chlamydiales bacterium]|nr:NAD-dependent succinate-semialdehyde dehydrogenase [Chlamydiales bacterium]
METFLEKEYHTCFIDGHFIEAQGKAKPHISPVNAKAWTKLHLASESDLKYALKTITYPPSNPYERSCKLHRMADYLTKHKDSIAKVITTEMGKVITQALSEVDYAVSYFRWFAEEAKRIYGLTIPSHISGKNLHTLPVPVGPCFVTTPWNYPLAMGARKIAPALAAGCPVIARPSSITPVSLLVLGFAAMDAELPAGNFSILMGNNEEISLPLMDSPLIKKFSFTGSTAIGTRLYQQGAPTLKKASLELGGNAPFLIFDDVDINEVAKKAATSKFRNNGQTCICPNRFLVQRKMYEPFIEAFTSYVKQFYIGDPFDEQSQISSVLHPASKDKIQQHKSDALEKGARAVLIDNNPCLPQILADVTFDMRIFKEETFGPLAGITPFDSDQEGLTLANQTIHGLAAYIFTQNITRGEKAIDALEFGIIGLNDSSPSCAEMPFGGLKASGFGKEGGPKGIYEYLNEKVISTCIT